VILTHLGAHLSNSPAGTALIRSTRRVTTDDSSKPIGCPNWCQTRHAGWDLEPEGHNGVHWPTVHGDDGSFLDIATGQTSAGDVGVWLSSADGANLTPEQARVASRQLLQAANWVENRF
jgi:hypothetical protein